MEAAPFESVTAMYFSPLRLMVTGLSAIALPLLFFKVTSKVPFFYLTVTSFAVKFTDCESLYVPITFSEDWYLVSP